MSSEGNRLQHGAAPSLPQGYIAAIDGESIGPDAGSCGTAAYRGEPVIVSDIGTDPLWERYRDFALSHGLKACWSTPIFSSSGKVIGTFALYSRKSGRPTKEQQEFIGRCTNLASIAIERKQAFEALEASERCARGQAETLSRTLDALVCEPAADRIVQHVLKALTKQLDAHSCSVWLRDQASGLLAFEIAWDEGETKTKANSRLAANSPSLRIEDVWPWPQVFRTGKPSVLEDIRQGPDFPWRAQVLAQGIVTILVVPMLIAGKVEGVLGIRFTEKRAFPAEQMELAQALAHQAMLAIRLNLLSNQVRQNAVLAERNRMARDIHDTLAQGFTGIITQLEAAKGAKTKEDATAVSAHIERAESLARLSLGEARRSVRALRSRLLDEGSLSTALDGLLKRMTHGTDLQADLVVDGENQSLPPEWEEGLLRIAQESLTNTLKHAKARRFRAALSFGPDIVRLQLTDDGCGFDPLAEHDGFGLLGMRERAEQMAGNFILRSEPGQGTEIIIELSPQGPSNESHERSQS
jgi:signal transduction histidine kinase